MVFLTFIFSPTRLKIPVIISNTVWIHPGLVEAIIIFLHRRELPSPSSAYVPPPDAVISHRFPILSFPPDVHRCCIYCHHPLFPLPMIPSSVPLHPPPNLIWWETVGPPTSCLYLRLRVVFSILLHAPPYGVTHNTLGGGGGPWDPLHIPPGCQGTWTSPRMFTPCAGPGRSCRRPHLSWL